MTYHKLKKSTFRGETPVFFHSIQVSITTIKERLTHMDGFRWLRVIPRLVETVPGNMYTFMPSLSTINFSRCCSCIGSNLSSAHMSGNMRYILTQHVPRSITILIVTAQKLVFCSLNQVSILSKYIFAAQVLSICHQSSTFRFCKSDLP